MRTSLSAILTIVTGLTVTAQNYTPIDTLTLSLDQCITIALDQSPTIKVADMEIKRLNYSRDENIGKLLPTLSFSGTYSRTLAKQVAYMNMGSFGNLTGGGTTGDDATDTEAQQLMARSSSGSTQTGIKMGLDNSYSVGFSASMPLVAVQLWKTLKLSDDQILEKVETARKSRLTLINQIENAYYGLLLAQDSKKVVLEAYQNALFSYDVYSKKFQVGAASEFDVLRTSVAVKNWEPQIDQADISIKQASLQLAILMGMDPVHAITPDTQLSSYEGTMFEDALYLQHSIAQNADLRLLDVQTQMLKKTVDVQKAAYYPTLALAANYNWTSSNDGVPFKSLKWNPYSMVALQLDVPLFSGFQRWNRVRQAEVQFNEMKFQRENLVRSLQSQADLAIDNININIKQISTTAESVRQAEKAHTIMEKSFEIGAASYLDLRDAELALTNARLAYNQAIYNYLVAKSNLQLLVGDANLEQYTIER